MTFFNYITIRTAKSVRKKLVDNYNKEGETRLFNQTLGIYSSRIFGICIYRSAWRMGKDQAEIKNEAQTNKTKQV